MINCVLVRETVAEDVQTPLVTVQRRTAVVPTGTPVTVDVGDVGVVIIAVPLTTVHKPEPGAGLLPASVNEPLLQFVWFGPAAATTNRSFLNETVAEEVQTPLVTVHLNTAVVPAGTPVTVVVGEVGVVMVAVPLTSVHKPVPGAGLLPAIVNEPVLHSV